MVVLQLKGEREREEEGRKGEAVKRKENQASRPASVSGRTLQTHQEH